MLKSSRVCRYCNKLFEVNPRRIAVLCAKCRGQTKQHVKHPVIVESKSRIDLYLKGLKKINVLVERSLKKV